MCAIGVCTMCPAGQLLPGPINKFGSSGISVGGCGLGKSGAKRRDSADSVAALGRGRASSCPQAWPQGPQRLRGPGRPERAVAQRREAPLTPEGRSRKLAPQRNRPSSAADRAEANPTIER